MASQRKKDALWKEKIGTSSIATKAKKSSSVGSAATNNPSSDKKQIPNYLKPTICSSGLVDHPTPPPRKLGNSSIKPSINRRRSFDKPLPSSSSVIHKSPHASLRSPSPILAKVNSLPKTLGKKTLQPSSNVRVNMAVNKIDPVISTTPEEERNDKESEQRAPQVESLKNENEVFSVSEINEEVKCIEINTTELVECEVAINENPSICEDVKLCELETKKDYAVDIETEGVGEKAVVEKVVIKNHDEKNEDKNDMEIEGLNKDAKKGDGNENEKENENENEKDEDIIEIAKKDALESNDDVVEIRENTEIESKELEIKGDINEEANNKIGEQANNEAANASGKEAQQQVHYNDMIEETKNKLLEKRKNKVKALVGAFETVISLQEPEP